jgi:two-component system, LytTR family, sensor kinase
MGRYKTVGVHILAWTTYVLILLLGSEKLTPAFWSNTVSTLIPIVILFYLNVFFLFPQYLQTRKFISLIALLIVFNFISICVRLILVTAFRQSGISDFMDNLFSPVLFWNQFRVNVLFIGISFAYWFAGKSYRAEKNQQRFERELLDARLNVLKNQINPHFLYNTLSFIYTKSLPFSEQLAGGIAKLSDMMRYSLSDTDADGKVSLEKEVLHIKNFIDIQQMRFDDRLNISFTINGDLCQCRVMPLLLITFVENAFKHGKLNDVNYPLSIRISIVQRLLSFEVRNRKANWKKEEAHGIGLENVRSRLELVYPQQHSLHIQDSADEFIVNLKINLQVW